jgi:hypothetical protein
MISFAEISKHFKKVETPKYLDIKIQEIALEHLGLKDMGKLRDTYDAQHYYNILIEEIRCEYAFEKFLGIDFDFDKRKNRNHPRLQYIFCGKEIQLIPISSLKPAIVKKSIPSILIYLKPEKFAYIGCLLFNSDIEIITSKEESILSKETYLDLKKMNLNKMNFFNNEIELTELLKKY